MHQNLPFPQLTLPALVSHIPRPVKRTPSKDGSTRRRQGGAGVAQRRGRGEEAREAAGRREGGAAQASVVLPDQGPGGGCLQGGICGEVGCCLQ